MITRGGLGVLPAIALIAAGCARVQDLGSDPGAEPDAAPSGFDPDALGQAPSDASSAPAPAVTALACPAARPEERAPCAAAVGWCNYRVDPARALAAKCACGVDGRWVCLVVRDDDTRARPDDAEPVAPTLTSVACTEGAPCADGVTCTIPQTRSCVCMSSGRLACKPLVR